MCKSKYISKRAKVQNAGSFSIKMTAGTSVLLCVLLLPCGVVDAARQREDMAGIIVRAPYWLPAGKVIKEMPAVFRASRFCPAGGDAISVGWHDYASIGRFADKDHPFDVLIYNGLPNPTQAKIISRQFPKGGPQPERFFIGRHRLVAVTQKASRLERLTLAQIQQLLRREDKEFKRPKLAELASQAECYIQADFWSRDYLKRTRMSFRKIYDWGRHDGYYRFRKDLVACHGPMDIVEKVRKDRNGIGFFLYDPHDAKLTAALKTVKVLAIGETDKGPFVKPTLEPVIQEDYPLSEPLILYLHPKAPLLARKFCEFAVSEEGAKIAAKHGLITPWHEKQYEGELRLKEMKAGKGVRLSVAGVRDAKDALGEMVIEYVRAKEVVQLSYAGVGSDVSAVGLFTSGEAGRNELLILSDKPSERAFEMYGKKWNTLGRDKEGKPDGAGPAEHVVAGRAVAIIVNPANKLASLTLGQIRAIFGGEANDWSVVSGTGLTASGGAVGIPIHAFGLAPRHSATKLFEAECLPARKFRDVTRVKGTAAAVAAVGVDPQAIAFVDLTAIPATGQAVKVLAIQIGSGAKAKIIHPTAENIKNAMYPLSRRLYLYVHPQASESAKGFASFMATCGQSVSSPYCDAVKATIAAYRAHGLIPLADAAITRTLKDALAADGAKAKR